jgi:hypothetical protein
MNTSINYVRLSACMFVVFFLDYLLVCFWGFFVHVYAHIGSVSRASCMYADSTYVLNSVIALVSA